MDAVLGFLNRPLFGLPIWIWLLIIAGGIFLARVIIPKITGSSAASAGTSSQGSLGYSAAGGVTSSNATPLDQSLYDPSTGIPLAVESAVNPATGLPNYNNLVGLQNTTSSIAQTQSNPTAGAGTAAVGTDAYANSTYLAAYNALQANPNDPTLQAGLNNAVKIAQQQSVADWEAHTGQTWTGGAGTYPAGWTAIPGLPGARTQ